MGWDYKNEREAIADMKNKIEQMEDAIKVVEISEEVEDDEIDTSELYYKLITVDTNNVGNVDPVMLMERRVNDFIRNSTDNFMPQGPVVYADGWLIQTLVDIDEL